MIRRGSPRALLRLDAPRQLAHLLRRRGVAVILEERAGDLQVLRGGLALPQARARPDRSLGT
jgi:hypothetical protein